MGGNMVRDSQGSAEPEDRATVLTIPQVFNRLFELVSRVKAYDNLTSAQIHTSGCDFLRRNPPRHDDCDCGGFRRVDEHKLDILDKIVDLVG